LVEHQLPKLRVAGSNPVVRFLVYRSLYRRQVKIGEQRRFLECQARLDLATRDSPGLLVGHAADEWL
jgi:hypothetical protein